MQKNRMFTKACLVLVIGLLAVSIGTIIKLSATASFALSVVSGNQTGGKMVSGSMTGTNTTSGITRVQVCTPHYPC
jgi:hypothetical protein